MTSDLPGDGWIYKSSKNADLLNAFRYYPESIKTDTHGSLKNKRQTKKRLKKAISQIHKMINIFHRQRQSTDDTAEDYRRRNNTALDGSPTRSVILCLTT